MDVKRILILVYPTFFYISKKCLAISLILRIDQYLIVKDYVDFKYYQDAGRKALYFSPIFIE